METEDIQIEYLRRSFPAFVRAAWPVVEPGTPYVHNWHLDCIGEHLQAISQRRIHNLLINVPPRHAKSLLVAVFWPAWRWLTCPEERWLFASYAEELSIRDSLKCRRLIKSSWYQETFGSVFAITDDQDRKSRFDNDRGGYRLATGAGGANTGEGADCLVADDPHNILEVESDLAREGVLHWWDEVMSTRLNDPATGCRVIVMQRTHQGDLSGHLLDREASEWHYLCLPARYETSSRLAHTHCPIHPDPRVQEGTPLWASRYDEPILTRLEAQLGPYAAAGQLQQRPVPRGGSVFRSEWFRPLPAAFDTPPQPQQATLGPGTHGAADDRRTFRQRLSYVQFWDLAYSAASSADYTVGLTAGLDSGTNLYLTSLFRTRVDEEDLVRVMAEHVGQLHAAGVGPTLIGVEEAAYRQPATQDLARRLMHRLAMSRIAVSVIPVKPSTDKVMRAQLPAGRAKAGFVYADTSAPWWSGFLQELLAFPKGGHDDQVDALSGVVQLAIERGAWLSSEAPGGQRRFVQLIGSPDVATGRRRLGFGRGLLRKSGSRGGGGWGSS